jgi:hypothetical protein
MAKSQNILGRLGVTVGADLDELEDGLTDAKRKVDQAADKIEEAGERGEQGFNRWTEGLSKALAVMGAIEAATKLVGVGFDVLEGDTTAAAEALKTLPIVGGVVEGFEIMLAGIVDHFELMGPPLKELKKRTEAIAEQSERMDRQLEASRGLDEWIASLEKANELAALDEVEARFREIEMDREEAIERFNDKIREEGLGALYSDEEIDRQRAVIQRFFDQQVEDARAAEQDRLETVESVERKIQMRRLEISGETEELQRRQINDSFHDRIEAAKDANNAELADRLRTLRDIELAQIDHDRREQGRRVSAGLIRRSTHVLDVISPEEAQRRERERFYASLREQANQRLDAAFDRASGRSPAGLATTNDEIAVKGQDRVISELEKVNRNLTMPAMAG